MSCDVNISSGGVLQERVDIDLPGLLPLTISRLYSTQQARESSILGFGWVLSLEIWVDLTADGISIHEGYQGPTPYAWAQCDGQNGPQVERADRRVSLRFADGSVRHFVTTTPSVTRFHLVRDSDPYGNTMSFEYDDGRLRRISTCEGRTVQLAYGSAGFLERITVADANATEAPIVIARYTIDANGDLVKVTDARGFSELYAYADHLLVVNQNRIGGRTYYAYDVHRRCCDAWQHDGKRIRHLEFDAVRSCTLVTDSFGAATLQRLNEAGAIVEQVDPLGYVTQSTYDDAGGFVAMFDEIGLIDETSTYDHTTRSMRENDAVGGEIRVEFDAKGRVARQSQLGGAVVAYAYDDHDDVTTVVSGDTTWHLRYDEQGRLRRIVDGNGYEIRQDFTRRGERVSDAGGVLEELEFDVLGNLVTYRDALGQATHFEYEGQDAFTAEIPSDGRATRYRHDGEDHLLEEVSPSGTVERYDYDSFGELVAQSDPRGVVSFENDADNRVSAITNRKGEQFRIVYDALDNEIEWHHFDGRVRRASYDARGRRTEIVDSNGGRTTFEYDLGDRVVRQELPDGSVQKFERDPTGRVTLITSEEPGGRERRLALSYDPSGLVVREEHDDYWLEHDYDGYGHPMGVRDSWGGATVYRRGFRYDLDSIEEGGRLFRFRWDAAGLLREILYPNGMRQILDVDRSGRVVQRVMMARSGEVLARRSWRYDEANRIVEADDSLTGVLHYQYDLVNRLVQVSRDDRAVESYAYDADDSLVGSHRGSGEVGRGDRVQVAGEWRFEYDDAGRLWRRTRGSERWEFEYDGDDQLIRVSRNGELVASYEYDLVNRRMRKVTPTGATSYLYDGSWALRAERHGDRTIRYIYLPGLGIPLAAYLDDGACYYYGIDHLGDPTEAWSEDDRLAAVLSQEAYGTERIVRQLVAELVPFPFLFPGQYYDNETGLCYNTFRYYNPDAAAYTTPDPLSLLAPGFNHYLYPRDPLTWIDPEGLAMELKFECKKTKKCDWKKMQCANAAARMKFAKLSREIKKRQIKKCSKCQRSKQREYFKKNCQGKTSDKHQVDHLQDLQAGGADKCCGNLVSLTKEINNCLGSVVRRMLKKVNKVIPQGTKIEMKGCSGGPCKNRDQHIRRPPKRDCKKMNPVC